MPKLVQKLLEKARKGDGLGVMYMAVGVRLG